MKKIISPIAFILVTLIGCNSSIDEEKHLTSLDKKIINSLEYKAFEENFKDLNEIDFTIHDNYKDALKAGITNKKELTDFYMDLLNSAKDKESMGYLKKIGILNPEELFLRRKILFNETIPKTVMSLGEKFPEIKQYSVEQIVKLGEIYKEQNLSL